ncbi:MAG TPA: hypothetical protein VNM72_03995 [Blastocatellia bacterium]|nr:hypothetical protein [Blastocatellia bacterium]
MRKAIAVSILFVLTACFLPVRAGQTHGGRPFLPGDDLVFGGQTHGGRPFIATAVTLNEASASAAEGSVYSMPVYYDPFIPQPLWGELSFLDIVDFLFNIHLLLFY